MDSSDFPEEGKRLLQQLELRLKSELDIRGLGMRSKLPFKVATLRELSLHRAVDLMRAALHCYDVAAYVPAVILTRALIETAAVLFCVRELVAETYKAGHLAATTDERLMQIMFGGRVPEAPQKAINIMTHLDKLDRKFEGMRGWYEQLSEVAHPNYMGLLGSYGEIDRTEFMVALGPNKDYHGMSANFGFPALLSGAEMVLVFNDRIVQNFPAFSQVCHSTPASGS